VKGLPNHVRELLNKAKESALLAVEIYNKPMVSFKSGGYISLMIIAWTSLFHAYFYKNKIKPYFRKGRRYERVKELLPSGEILLSYKFWDISECVKQYYKDKTDPARKNIEFIVPIRNMIEHRSLPVLDANIFGECQALLLNLNEFIEREFSKKYSLKESLSFALQFSPSTIKLMEAPAKELRSNGLNNIVDYIKKYRSSLGSEIFESQRYSFKAILIKVANHEARDTLPIRFINYNDLSGDERDKLKDLGIVLIKEKYVPSAIDTMNVSMIVEEVRKAIGKHFSMNMHVNCWKKYGVRPIKGDPHPEKTITKYCVYDARHKDYGYTKEWVGHLARELANDQKYELIKKNAPKV
jgi:hypothetical protein